MSFLFRPLTWLLRTAWRLLNFTRLLLVNLALLLILVVVVLALRQEQPSAPAPEGALVLDLAGELVEQSSSPLTGSQWLSDLMSSDARPRQLVLGDIRYALTKAKQDTAIKGVVLDLSDLQPSSLEKLQQITAALDDFRQGGKPVVAMGDFYSQGQYLLAAHADTVLLNPAGAVLIQGMERYQLYFKQALAKFDVTPYIFRTGRYKSFVEPYIRDDMSPEAREANGRWLGQLWQQYVTDVAKARKIRPDAISPDKGQLLARFQAAQGNAAQYALDQGLVDQLVPYTEMVQQVAQWAGASQDEPGFKHTRLRDYLRSLPPRFAENGQPKIGLIVASGTILNGEQPAGSIGGESLARLIRQATKDKAIKALVLRIDSPGGSAFAAEQIRTELLALKQAGKPLVVSMGSTAASGGYWMAANADKIFAEPSTLTGSIGVFGMFATFDQALAKLGVHSDGLGTTDQSGLSPLRPLPEHIQQLVQMNVENTYQRFIGLVAEGRGMTPDEVDHIAQGRVWSGEDAKANGLVDELGDLPAAVASAAELAELPNYDLQPIQAPLTSKERLLRQLFDDATQTLVPQSLMPLLSQWQHSLAPLTQLNDPMGQYALCEFCTNN